MAYTTIDKPTDYFNTKLYTGNGTNATGITGVGFQPDWVWCKQRDGADNYVLGDSVRGGNKQIYSNLTNAETSSTDMLQSFNSDGFTLGTDGAVNRNGNTYASWNWKKTATAGFDIVLYTGNASNRTISHSCGAIPKMIIIKDRDADDNWNVYTAPTGNDSHLHLNLGNGASGSSGYWNDTTPTSSVFSLGSDNSVNKNGNDFIAYCFAEKQGYSKINSYTGNGDSDGSFIYTGFKPAFVMCKISSGSDNWVIVDNKRAPFNEAENTLRPNIANAEYTGTAYGIDILSNGFKCRTTDGNFNGSGSTYIYMAFAENPFVTSTGIPGLAR